VNRAAGVGAQCWNSSLPQAFEELQTGMSVGIVFSGRNNAEAWLDGGTFLAHTARSTFRATERQGQRYNTWKEKKAGSWNL
jgi:hypothetical protein